jgi:hypothetical protein
LLLNSLVCSKCIIFVSKVRILAHNQLMNERDKAHFLLAHDAL